MSLVVQQVALQMATAIKPLLEQIRAHDRALAEQLHQSSSSRYCDPRLAAPHGGP